MPRVPWVLWVPWAAWAGGGQPEKWEGKECGGRDEKQHEERVTYCRSICVIIKWLGEALNRQGGGGSTI